MENRLIPCKRNRFVSKGHLSVKLDTISVGLGLAFNIQKLPNGNVVPVLNVIDCKSDISTNDLKPDIDGNVWADFADTFTVFFQSTIVDLINDNIATVLTQTIPDSLNSFIYNQNGETEVLENWYLDWQTLDSIIITETAFELGIKGIMFDDRLTESEWSTTFPDMPYNDETQAT